MASTNILELNLTDLSKLIAARELSSAEAVKTALTQLDQLEAKVNAFITVLREQAPAEANKADQEIARGNYRGPLHGVPVTIKDMFETAGVLTTGGSKILADWIPETDSALVEHLRAAGAIIIGKTNLDEFGHGGTSTLSHFGPVHNPWNVDRIAGGSSGGSAAAVAAGIGPLSYGTETGSSVRRPASYCGIVGFKPTFGIISRHGSFRGAWSQDHVGLFARSVQDITLGLDPVVGFDARDPASVHQDKPAYAARLDANVKGLRIGVLPRFLEGRKPRRKTVLRICAQSPRRRGMRDRRLGRTRAELRRDDIHADQFGRERRHQSSLIPRAAPRLRATREPRYSRGNDHHRL